MATSRHAETSRLLSLISRGEALTRADLQKKLGLSRVTLSKRLATLVNGGLVEEAGQFDSTGGRPRTVFNVRSSSGLILAADIDTSVTHVAVADFGAHILDSAVDTVGVSAGPGVLLSWVRKQWERMLKRLQHPPDEVLGIGLSLPGPVDQRTGRLVHPATMPGWHGVRVADLLRPAFAEQPVAAGRDSNALALSELRHGATSEGMVLVRIGDGISATVVQDGDFVQGSSSMAGGLGHLSIPEGQLCRCGRFGCLESVAGGWAIMQRLGQSGWNVETCEEVVRLATVGDSLTVELLRDAGRFIGRALAPLVCVLGPASVVIDGPLAQADGLVTDPIREGLRSSVPDGLLAPDLVRRASTGPDAGLVGAALLAQRLVTDPVHLGALMRRLGPTHSAPQAAGAVRPAPQQL